jgi:hypothetical protein
VWVCTKCFEPLQRGKWRCPGGHWRLTSSTETGSVWPGLLGALAFCLVMAAIVVLTRFQHDSPWDPLTHRVFGILVLLGFAYFGIDNLRKAGKWRRMGGAIAAAAPRARGRAVGNFVVLGISLLAILVLVLMGKTSSLW